MWFQFIKVRIEYGMMPRPVNNQQKMRIKRGRRLGELFH